MTRFRFHAGAWWEFPVAMIVGFVVEVAKCDCWVDSC